MPVVIVKMSDKLFISMLLSEHKVCKSCINCILDDFFLLAPSLITDPQNDALWEGKVCKYGLFPSHNA